MTSKTFTSRIIAKTCKGKCDFYEACIKETNSRKHVNQKEIDMDYSCRFYRTKPTKIKRQSAIPRPKADGRREK